MSGRPAKLLGCLALSLFVAAPAHADTIMAQKLSVVVAKSDVPGCNDLGRSLEFHFRSRLRFTLTTGKDFDHLLEVNCSKDEVEGTWTTNIPTGVGNARDPVLVTTIKLNIQGDLAKNHSSTALAMVTALFTKLPWDGEFNALVKAKKIDGKTQLIGPNRKGSSHQLATLAAGYTETLAVSNCVPFEVGALKKGAAGLELDIVGEGAVTAVGTFTSPAEVYLDQKVAKKLLVFRVILAADASREIRKLVARCKKKIGEGEGDSLSRLVGGDFGAVLSKETIEINMVTQRAGLYFSTIKGDKGYTMPVSILGYVHSRADVGELLAMEGRAVRSVLTKNYQPTTVGAPHPEITIAEAFPMLRYAVDDIAITFGPGLFLNKLNTPYPNGRGDPESPVDARHSYTQAALGLGFRSEFDSFIADALFVTSLSKSGRFISFDAALNYSLTETWYVGGDLYLLSMGESANQEPGLKSYNVGGHIGFMLKRAKPWNKKK